MQIMILHFNKKADLAYAVQKDLEEKVICVVERAMRMNDCKNIVLSGGVFHNVMINELLTSKYPDYNFFADPICDDAGHSYGGAIWFLKSYQKMIVWYKTQINVSWTILF